MKEEIENILGLAIPSTNKLVLIYFKLNGDGCISRVQLAEKLSCSVPGMNNSIKQLVQMQMLEMQSRLGKQSHYKLAGWLSGEDYIKDSIDTLCLECGESTGEDAVETIQGVFCDNECFGRHVLDDDQIEEIYDKK